MNIDLLPNLNEEDKALMKNLLASGNIKHKYAVRLQTILNRADGKSPADIASFLGIYRTTVSAYVNRYNSGGIESLLHDKTRKPGKEPISLETKNRICAVACREKPKDGTHWSVRSLAKRFKIGKTTINAILRERNIKPHLSNGFQFSNDPEFEEKLTDVVGLYMNPPDNALVLCIDEKSQIQALERTQPILPVLPGVPERQTHDYYRHGTTTLFAALDALHGNVIGDCKDTHTSDDFIDFLKTVDKKSPKGKVLHIILDNYSTHKKSSVKEYITSMSGRFVLHFIPTHSSWLNLVERWFAEITNKRIRRESWNNVKELIAAIKSYIKTWNKSKRCFKWSKPADEITRKIDKLRNYSL